MRRTILLLMLLALSSQASADESSRKAAAVKLLEVSRAAEMIETMYDSMQPQFEAMAEQIGIDEEQRPIFDRHLARVFDVLREELNWQKMEPYMIDAYAEVYTEQELLGLVEFYESPLGQKFMEKMPEMMAVSMEMTQSMMGGFYARLEELQAELMADLEAAKAEE